MNSRIPGQMQAAGRAPLPGPGPARFLQRKCACGSHTLAGAACRECGENKKRTLQPRLRVGAVDDPFEAEADRVSEQVLAGSGGIPGGRAAPRIQRLPARGASAAAEAPQSIDSVLAGAGRALDAPLRHDMERRFDRDFSQVRVHTDGAANRSATEIQARAYTAGRHVVFGPGQFAPATADGKRLLAHELTHVVQQADGAGEALVRRAPLEIFPAKVAGALKPEQRRAAASCDIGCGGTSIGTLHAMPTFFHASRGAPLAGAAGADGIGTALHFLRNGTPAPAKSGCDSCTGFKIIQVLKSNEPSDSRGKESFVDNAAGASPFYGDVYLSGTGLHTIPANYPDAGEEIKTTASIYDRPFRAAARLDIVKGSNFYWEAEACVTCLRPTKDKVLGCATYGFKRAWDAKAKKHGPVEVIEPGCRASPSAHFVTTLKTDTSTSSYKFET